MLLFYEELLCVQKTRLNVLELEPFVVIDDFLSSRSGNHHPQNMFDRKPMSANDRFPAINLRILSDSLQEKLFLCIEIGVQIHH